MCRASQLMSASAAVAILQGPSRPGFRAKAAMCNSSSMGLIPWKTLVTARGRTAPGQGVGSLTLVGCTRWSQGSRTPTEPKRWSIFVSLRSKHQR